MPQAAYCILNTLLWLVTKQSLGFQESRLCQWNKLSHFIFLHIPIPYSYTTKRQHRPITTAQRQGRGKRREPCGVLTGTRIVLWPFHWPLRHTLSTRSLHVQLYDVSGRQDSWFQLIKIPVYCRSFWIACWVCTIGTNRLRAFWLWYTLSPSTNNLVWYDNNKKNIEILMFNPLDF